MKCLTALFLLVLAAVTIAAAEEVPMVPPLDNQTAIHNLSNTNRLLQEKIRLLEGRPAITTDTLSQKTFTRLKEVADDVRQQRQAMNDFEGFVKWMSGTVSGYEKYVQAGSYAAVFAKALPIPYAGQAASLTKFVSQSVVSLNRTSVAITSYLATSAQFLSLVDAADKTGSPDAAAAASRFAQERLIREMEESQIRLRATSEISGSALSFLQALDHCMGSTDEYWSKAKSIFKKGTEPAAERGHLSESIRNLKAKTESFDGKLKLFSELSRKDAPRIAALGTYEELERELVAASAAGMEQKR